MLVGGSICPVKSQAQSDTGNEELYLGSIYRISQAVKH